MAIAPGTPAPDFTLPDQDKNPVTLSELRGRPVVLAFHPFAFTGICETEVCSLRDEMRDFSELGAEVVVVSPDSVFVHKHWADELALPYRYLSDYWPHGEVAKRYGILDESKGAPTRSTFVIDAEGIVRHAAVQESLPGEARDVQAIKKAVAELG
jgi:mycoredoxin-dependent peroxiredoxin